MFDPQPTDMYFKIKNDSLKYVVAGVGSFNKSIKIPVEISVATSGSFNFMIDFLDNTASHNAIYLEDKLNNIFYNLSDGVKTLNLNSGVYKNRFFITFRKDHKDDEDDIIKNNLLIYFDKTSSEIVIRKNELTIKSATLISLINGKNIMTWKKLKNEERLFLPVKDISDGVYLIRINTNKGIIKKKIFIFK